MRLGILVTFIVVLDQLSKSYIQANMRLGESIPVLPDIFHITYILNPGAAFGLFADQTFFFIGLAVAMVLAVIYFYPAIKKESAWMKIGVGLLVGGAIGNLVDRIQIGKVVDFFDFRIWPIFNIADIGIVCGAFIIVTAAFLEKDKSEVNTRE